MKLSLSPAIGLLPLFWLGVPYGPLRAFRRGVRLVMLGWAE